MTEGTGKYLLIISYVMEGSVVRRFETEEALLSAIQSGDRMSDDGFIIAKELNLKVREG